MQELIQLRRQNHRNAVHIQHLEALQAKQNAVLQRKISDANAARKKLKDYQSVGAVQGAAGKAVQIASVSSASVTGSVAIEIQPNAQAPILRNERARRDWLEKELDMCNQSYEYQRILDGELAQRAQTNKKLKEVDQPYNAVLLKI